ncbi:MAG: ribonuclease D [Geminicoccaceae bacterium]
MSLITDNTPLAAFIASLEHETFVTVDTEFMRDRTYYSQLCLIQIAGEQNAAVIDALVPGIDLTPVYDLFQNNQIMKVLHAPRQDLEIFFQARQIFPRPLFDTQLAAMFLGYGDEVGYESLVNRIANARLDKSSRLTDWSHRPHTDAQVNYALSDVTHLRTIYTELSRELEKRDRISWVREETERLLDPALYEIDRNDVWRRLKIRSKDPRFLAVLRAVAAWREDRARSKDVPRARILRDEVLAEIAARKPSSVDDLRSIPRVSVDRQSGEDIVAAIAEAADLPDEACPRLDQAQRLPKGIGPLTDLLKVFLRLACEEHDLAQRLVAVTKDLELFAAGRDKDLPFLEGWRLQVFGADAKRLRAGEIALRARGKRVEPVETAG